MIIVDDDVDCSYEIEGDAQQPKDPWYPCREKCQHSQQPGCEVTVRSEGGKFGWQIGADDAGNEEDEPEEAEAVQSSYGRVAPRPGPSP